MFNFFVVLAGHDKVTDAGRFATCRRKINPHDYKEKYKKWRTFRKHGFERENSLKISDEKRTETLFSTFQKTQSRTQGP